MYNLPWKRIFVAFILTTLLRPSTVDAGSAMYCTYQDIKPGLDAPQLIDVRDTDSYVRSHIPEALHIPAYAIKTKGFLRNRDIVLMDAGWGNPVLERVCAELNESGWKSVKILRGGLSSWARAGLPLEGDGSDASNDWDIVSPCEIFSVQQDQLRIRWWIRCQRDAPDGFGWASQSMDNASAQLLQTDGEDTVLVCTDDDRVISSLRMTRDIHPNGPNIFFVEGGSARWDEVRSLSSMHSKPIRISSTNVIQANARGELPCGGCPMP